MAAMMPQKELFVSPLKIGYIGTSPMSQSPFMAADEQLSLSSEDIQALKGLVPGSTIDLQIATPTSPKRVKTQYVGMEIPNCMIFQIPVTAKWALVRDLLLPENEVVVRYVLEGDSGQVVAFRVKVLKLLSHPSGLLMTTFPTGVQSFGLRATKRSQPGIAVDVNIDDAPDISQATGIIVDVSVDGCRIAMPVKPDWPTLVQEQTVTMTYSYDGQSLTLQGEVKNSRQQKEYIYYGVKFDDEQESVNTLLKRHILLG